MNFYDLNAETSDGKIILLNELRGKVSLVVNTASACRFTPHLRTLQTIYERYHSDGFEILAFPSNDFGNQEPLNDPEILNECTKEWGITFRIFRKSHVVGKDRNPIFAYLSRKDLNNKWNAKPWWNFQKYLIDKAGNLVNFWLPLVKPTSASICRSIEAELSKNF